MYQEYLAEFWYSAKALENSKVSFLIPTGEAIKGGSSKAPTGSKIGHSKRRKESSSAMYSNPGQPSVSTLVDTEMHKEDHQATGDLTSLGVTNKEIANPQLSSGVSALNLNKPIFSAYFIIHSESASGHDVSTDFTAKADPGLSALNDSIPPQQGMDEGTKSTSYDHISAGTDPHVLADQTKSASTAIHGDKEKASSTIKLEDLTKLVSQIQPSFKDLDSPKDDHVIIVNESDKDDPNAKTKDTSVLRSSSPRFSQVLESTSSKARDQSIPALSGQADMIPTEGEKDTNHATISQLFQRRAEKDAEAEGEHIHLTEEQINHQKKLAEEAKAEAAKQEGEARKAKLIDLLGPKIVHKYYKYKLQYDRYCDLMLNRRAESRITKCDVLTKNGPIIVKVYIEDGTSEVIPNFKACDLYLELGINLDIPLSMQDPLEKLNDLANKKRKYADDIHDYFKANKRLKSSVQYEDHSPGTVLNEPVLEIFFRLHEGLRLDDHAKTFSSLLLAKVDKRNLNPLKQMRTIEQLRLNRKEEEIYEELDREGREKERRLDCYVKEIRTTRPSPCVKKGIYSALATLGRLRAFNMDQA
uniref:Uncharacterized protein n=1 Tax=Tanacetum cinerariifolium TaxID=118510 RepID=A0A6L2KQL5_TANCI|nr:hypothetical protein [Tanacetum cinerariifolium]